MEIFDAIQKRRSVRHFRPENVSEDLLLRIIDAGRLAPSAKNGQPWFFYVVHDEGTKKRLIHTLQEGANCLYTQYLQKGTTRVDIRNAQKSFEAMEEAAAIIIVTHMKEYLDYQDDGIDWNLHARDCEVADILSVGAAIENMLLAAEAFGLGTLWVCDIFYAYDSLKNFLGTSDSIVSAICIGVPAEFPDQRPRIPREQKTIFLQKGNQ